MSVLVPDTGPMLATFTVHGIPQPQGSMRRNPHGLGMHSDNPNLKGWRQELVDAAIAAWAGRPPLLGPVAIGATFVFPRLQSHYRTGQYAHELKPSAPLAHATKPDLDKLQRAVGDALKLAGVYRDDSQICTWDPAPAKVYGDHPGAWVTITSL